MNRIFDLSSPHESEIIYEISKFPDGQRDIRIIDLPIPIESVTITSHFQSFADLEFIICAKKCLDGIGIKDVSLFIPYVLGARSDRKFFREGTSYLRDVIAPIINSMKFEHVTCFDPHSDVCEAVINNLFKLSTTPFYTWAKTLLSENFAILSPDAGALKKIYDVAKIMDCERIFVCSKHRNIKTGKITHTEVPFKSGDEIDRDMEMVIIDDICDGGRTFTEIVKAVRSQGFNNKVSLIVSHGIFSAGTEILFQSLDKIICTDSYNSTHQVTEKYNLFK